jgi:Flp pilus assembly protein TadG
MSRPPLFRRLTKDSRGLSAVEFALLAPVMIAFYFGLAEFCQGYMAQKRMGHVSAMVADLVSQTDVVTPEEVDDIFDIGQLIMKPFSATPLKQRVSSLTRDDKGVVRVDWSKGDGLIDNGESVIMSEATYDYDSPVDYLMPAVTKFSSTYYLRPRNVEKVGYDD